MKRLAVWTGLAVLLLLPPAAAAESDDYSVRVAGRRRVVVTTADVRLGDVAGITSQRTGADEIVIGLKKITLVRAPQPGRTLNLSAQRILERLREEGVNLKAVGYALPRVIRVERAARLLTALEVRTAIEHFLSGENRDVDLKSIDYQEDVQLVPGVTKLSVASYELQQRGQAGFVVTAGVAGEPDVRFKVRAQVDEWRELPVAARPLLRGAVIASDDVRMARLNLNAVPKDAARSKTRIVGLEASRSIAFGEVFRRDKLAIPPLIESGSAVTLRYRSSLLTATATGKALEDGILGQDIKVRNLSSNKVIQGVVLEPGLVGVGP